MTHNTSLTQTGYKSGMEHTQEVLEQLLLRLGLSFDRIYIRKGVLHKELVFDIVGGYASTLFRRDNEALTALTTLVRGIVEKGSNDPDTNFSIDADGTRSRKIKALQEHAIQAAEQVLSRGVPYELAPMTSFERKIVHDALSGYAVTTESVGNGRERRIVITRSDSN